MRAPSRANAQPMRRVGLWCRWQFVIVASAVRGLASVISSSGKIGASKRQRIQTSFGAVPRNAKSIIGGLMRPAVNRLTSS